MVDFRTIIHVVPRRTKNELCMLTVSNHLYQGLEEHTGKRITAKSTPEKIRCNATESWKVLGIVSEIRGSNGGLVAGY